MQPDSSVPSATDDDNNNFVGNENRANDADNEDSNEKKNNDADDNDGNNNDYDDGKGEDDRMTLTKMSKCIPIKRHRGETTSHQAPGWFHCLATQTQDHGTWPAHPRQAKRKEIIDHPCFITEEHNILS